VILHFALKTASSVGKSVAEWDTLERLHRVRAGAGERRVVDAVPIWEPAVTPNLLRRWEPPVPHWARDP
jgi:hypothetical protein